MIGRFVSDVARGWSILLDDWARRHCWIVLRRHKPARRWDGAFHRWAECGVCGHRYTTHYLHVPPTL